MKRGVQSIKEVLAKTKSLTVEKLSELCFNINNHQSQDGSGTANSSFLRRAPRTNLPNSMETEVKHSDMITIRHDKQMKIALQKGRTSKDVFKCGDAVRVQDPLSKKWLK